MSQESDNESAIAPVDSALPTNELAVHFYRFGRFTLDLTARHLLRDGDVVPMTAKVFDTLLVLVKNHSRAVTKEELIHAVWPNTFVSDDSLVQNISAIRRALGDDPSQPHYVATLARRGYRFVAPVEEHNGEAVISELPQEALGGKESTGPGSMSQARNPGPARRMWWLTAGAFAAGLVLAGLFLTFVLPARSVTVFAAPMRFREMLPPGQVIAEDAALSPDGRTLAFVASDANGRRQLWMRMLDSDAAHPIEGTTGAREPFWSPDSEHIAFFGGGSQIKQIPRSGGPERPVIALTRGLPLGGTWTTSDRILFCDRGKIFAVNASGGDPTPVVEPTTKLTGDFKWPRALPDGRHFLFVVSSENPNQSGTYVGDLDSHDVVRVLNSAESPAEYVASGYILYVRDHALMAQPFDVARGAKGQSRALFGDLSDTIDISTTPSGVLGISESAYGARAAWVDREGRELSGFKLPTLFQNVTISPDNKQALATSFDAGTLTLWQMDLERNVSMRVSTNAGFPAWNPDGSRFAYITVGNGGAADVVVRSTSATDSAVLLKNDEIKVVTDWSMDGRYILFTENREGVFGIPAVGEHAAWPVLNVAGSTGTSSAHLSSDGKALIYVSNESGVPEVYVTSFPHPASKQQVSAGGGSQPVWRRDGRELFYLSPDRHVMAVSTPGDHLTPGKPQPLFAAPAASGPFAVSPDGQRFLVIERDHTGDRGAITLLTNWIATK